MLLNQIKAKAFERAKLEKKTHNFELALPEHLAEQADEMLKSSYSLEFLGIGRITDKLPKEFKGKLPSAGELRMALLPDKAVPKKPKRK